ncbi:MAG TPA: P-loop NTPase fold protein [Lacunisphaera sp.]|nr:P-loop NTPase fold protein [Lacunisphaera sp.]
MVEQAKGFLKEAPADAKGNVPEEIQGFRQEFKKLLSEAGIERLVVLIDDLDRCLPGTIVETLEAIRSLKQLEDLETDDRVRQKLRIDQLYWNDFMGVSDWGIVTEQESSPGLEWNLEFAAGVRSMARHPHLAKHVPEAEQLARAWLLDDAYTLDETAAKLGEQFGTRATGTTLLRHLLATGAFPEADWTVRFDLDRDLPLLHRRPAS